MSRTGDAMIPAIKDRQHIAAMRIAPPWVMPLVRTLVMTADLGIAAFSFILAFKLYLGGSILSPTAWAWSRDFVPYAGIFLFAVPCRLAMLFYQRIYRFHGAFSFSQDAASLFRAVTVGSLLIVGWAFLFRGGFAFREYSYSRAVFVIDFGIALILYIAFHLALRYVQTVFRGRGINLIPTLIVGADAEVARTAVELKDRPDLGYLVVGIVWHDAAGVGPQPDTISGLPVLGGTSDLADLIRELRIQEVIVTTSDLGSDVLFDAMMQTGREHRVEYCFAPSALDVLPEKTRVERIGVLPMVRLFREPLSDSQRFIKRLSDLILAAAAFLMTLPVWILTSILIKLDSRGPVLFRQERVGMDGRVFLCYKFRSMIADSDESVHREAYKKNIEGASEANIGDTDEPVFGKVRDDPRITRVGRGLRRTSLDELPQILNVLLGDMSIVGPRPPIPYEVEQYEVWQRKRLEMKPGITGLWQVSGRSRLPFDEMVRVDIYYIENWSLLLDLKIILRTPPAVFRGDGAG